jgi:uncharacterized membrane protein YqjE
VVLFWDTHRLMAMGGMTLLFLAIGVGALLVLRARARAAPRPFETTLRELSADREMLMGKHD